MRESRSSLSRAFTLLDAYREHDADLALTELAARSGLPLSTAHRMAADLIDWGALERTPRGLRLGMRLFELGQLVSPTRTLRDVALPFMEDVYETTHCAVNLGTLDGLDVVYVDRLNGHRSPAALARVGNRLPVHATALGKAMLAQGPAGLVQRVLNHGLAPVTERSVTDPAEFRRQLAEVRRTGVAMDLEEMRPGVICVAAALMVPDGAPAAISVSGVESVAAARRVAPVVAMAARWISRSLGR